METTNRGFKIFKFKDRNGVDCNIQESSLYDEDCIWLGCDKIQLKHFKAGEGWTDVVEPDVHTIHEHYQANTRMHLTRDQAKVLIKHLQTFVETGLL